MNILIINGTPANGWEKYESGLADAVDELSNEHNIKLFTVKDMNINYFRGCWNCWLKTREIGKLFQFIIKYTNLSDMYFIRQLKKNRSYKNRLTRPYQKNS